MTLGGQEQQLDSVCNHARDLRTVFCRQTALGVKLLLKLISYFESSFKSIVEVSMFCFVLGLFFFNTRDTEQVIFGAFCVQQGLLNHEAIVVEHFSF